MRGGYLGEDAGAVLEAHALGEQGHAACVLPWHSLCSRGSAVCAGAHQTTVTDFLKGVARHREDAVPEVEIWEGWLCVFPAHGRRTLGLGWWPRGSGGRKQGIV